MTVKALYKHHVATIGPGAAVIDAAQRMRTEHVGSLIVVEQRAGAEVPIGILTDRDIVVGVVAKNVSAEQLTVGDIMSRDIISIGADETVDAALQELGRRGVRRAPVVDHRGALVGVLSIDDVVEHLAAQLNRLADLIRLEPRVEARARP